MINDLSQKINVLGKRKRTQKRNTVRITDPSDPNQANLRVMMSPQRPNSTREFPRTISTNDADVVAGSVRPNSQSEFR